MREPLQELLLLLLFILRAYKKADYRVIVGFFIIKV
jgi:hypothetical protein